MTADSVDELTVDLAERATRAAQTWRPGASIVDVRPLTGGASSLTFLAHARGVPATERDLVLKVAPPGLAPLHNRDVLRQARLLRALDGQAGVAVPPVYFEDAGAPPGVPPFLAMEFVPGECLEPVLADRPLPVSTGDIRRRAIDAARMMAALHHVVPSAVGLGDEPDVPITAEIDRWTRAFTTVGEDLRGDYERCAEALHASIPVGVAPAVTHGDFRLGNTLCEGGRVNAIIDWEIWAVGDPRVDVTWFTFFTDEALHPAAPSHEPSGMPSAGELLAAYADAGGAPLDDLSWFDALTRYKEAAVTALLVKRARKSGSVTPALDRMTPALPVLVRQALELVGA